MRYAASILFLSLSATLFSQDFVATNFASGSTPTYIAVADLDGDGFKDIITCDDAASNNVHVQLNNGSGGFGAPQDYTAGNRCYGVASADFNGDNKPDIVVANFTTGSISVFNGKGDGTFQAPTTPTGTLNSPRAIATGDFNGDNKADILVMEGAAAALQCFINKGDGTFNAPTSSTFTGSSPIAIAVGDIDGNNTLDVVCAVFGSNKVAVLLNNGAGSFTAQTPLTTGTNPATVALTDLNGDNKLDVVVGNSADGTISVFLNNGAGAFGTEQTYAVGTNPRGITSGDFNLDGKLDIAVANFDSNNVSVLKGTGTGTLLAAVNYNTGSGPNAIIAATLNAGSSTDLVTVNSIGNNISVLLNRPDATHMALSAPASSAAGTQFAFSVSAKDGDNGTDPNFVSKVHFSSSDPQAVLPADYTFVAADAGVKSFTATLFSAGSPTITATTTTGPAITGSANVAIANDAPAINSIAASPNPVHVGQSVQFSSAASDINGPSLSYMWDFGDGQTGSGTSPVHTYAAAATYTVTLMVSDGSVTSQSTLRLIVGSATDLDGDGFSDALELAAGSSISDASSTPIGAALGASAEFTVKKLNVKLNFGKVSSDSVMLQGSIPVSGLQPLEGRTLLVDVGGIGRKYNLNEKGSAGSKFDFAQMKASKTRPLSLMVKLQKQDLAASLSAAGLANADTSTTVTLPVTIVFQNAVYTATATLDYKARKGKTGSAR